MVEATLPRLSMLSQRLAERLIVEADGDWDSVQTLYALFYANF